MQTIELNNNHIPYQIDQLQCVNKESLKILDIIEKSDASKHLSKQENNFNPLFNLSTVMEKNINEIDIALKQPQNENYSSFQNEKNNNSPQHQIINNSLESDAQKEIILNQYENEDDNRDQKSQIQVTQQQINQICKQSQQVPEYLVSDQQQISQNQKKQKIVIRFLFKQEQINQQSNDNYQSPQSNEKITNKKISQFNEKQVRKRKKCEQKVQEQQQQIQINNDRQQEEQFENKTSTSTANKSHQHQKVNFFLLSALPPEKFQDFQYHIQMTKKIKYSLIGDFQNDSIKCNLCMSKYKRLQDLVVHWKKKHKKEFKQVLPQYEI